MEGLITIAKDTQAVQLAISELLARLTLINKFEDVPAWKNQAQAVIPELEGLNERLQRFIARQEAELAELQSERSELPVTKKLFASRQDEKTVEADIAAARQAIEANDAAISMLHEAMASSPTSQLERKEMLKALKELRKALNAEKRAINQQIRAIKIKARLDLAQWKGVTEGTVGKAAHHQRASIKLMRKAQLEPQEAARAMVKQRLSDVNRRIKWVASFSGEEE
jgi:chromosome segregation ATPase